MAIQMRRGLRQDFDPTQMVAGEWAVSVDSSTSNQIVWMCFGAGVVKRMGTYEDFQTMIGEITDDIRDDMLAIEAEVQALADAVGDDKDAVALMKTTIEQTDLPAIQDYVTICQTSAQNASLSASNASGSATQASTKATEAQSWAIGGTGTRQGEDTNNAKYWSERAQSTSLAQSDWTENDDTDPSYIAHKPFKTIGTGLNVDGNGALNADGVSSYNDLSNKPQINGNTLTGNKSNAELGIPTKTSDLQNDSGFITDIPVATSSTAGKVKPDGTTTSVNQNGEISVIGGGGMEWDGLETSLRKNLFDLSKVEEKNLIFGNLEIQFNDDNSITLNGEMSATNWFRILETGQDPHNLKQSGTFILSADFDSTDTGATLDVIAKPVDSSETVTLASYPSDPEFTIADISLYSWVSYRFVSHGVETVNDFTFRPMLRYASITDSKITPFVPDNVELAERIEKKGEELADVSTFYGAKNILELMPLGGRSEVINGVTFTVNDDETVTVNGTATQGTYFTLRKNPDLPFNTDLILSGTPYDTSNNNDFLMTYWKSGEAQRVDAGRSVKFQAYTPETGKDVYLQIFIKSGYTADNILFKPMIRLASIADDTYVPYAMTNTNLTQNKIGKFSDTTYVPVDSIAYDETNKVLGLKVNGADTVIPFKKGGLGDAEDIVMIGGYMEIMIALNKEGNCHYHSSGTRSDIITRLNNGECSFISGASAVSGTTSLIAVTISKTGYYAIGFEKTYTQGRIILINSGENHYVSCDYNFICYFGDTNPFA